MNPAILGVIASVRAGAEIVILATNEVVKYKDILNSDATDYSAAAYDDSAWLMAQGPFGSTNVPEANTTIVQGHGVWVRKTYNVTSHGQFRITGIADDDFWVYIDGVQVLSGGLSEVTTYVNPSHLGNTVFAIKGRDAFSNGPPNGFFLSCHIEQLT